MRWPDSPLAQEHRLQEFKVYAAMAYARANKLNRIVFDSPRPRLGIIACGKAWLDVRQALDDLGIDEKYAADIGLRLFKVGMPWPLEAESVRHFAQGLEEILVVEEKRQIIEYQLKEMLYNWREDVRPARRRQVRRNRRMAGAGQELAAGAHRGDDAGAGGARHRRAPRALSHRAAHRPTTWPSSTARPAALSRPR
jgi:TPP-dependent indolepyruvate ferredoxin oxidoreductase alpha subunit